MIDHHGPGAVDRKAQSPIRRAGAGHIHTVVIRILDDRAGTGRHKIAHRRRGGDLGIVRGGGHARRYGIDQRTARGEQQGIERGAAGNR